MSSTLPSSSAEDTSTLPQLFFRDVQPTDLPAIYALERSSYPADEAASRSKLQYRQHQAAIYFRCAVIFEEDVLNVNNNDGEDKGDDPNETTDATSAANATTESTNPMRSLTGKGTIIGFITSTRCRSFTSESMSLHDPTGHLLAVHSVVVMEKWRHMGVGSAMLQNYLRYIGELATNKKLLKYPIESIVLISKKEKLGFYVENGFRVEKKSGIVHGAEPWFECVWDLPMAAGAAWEDRRRKRSGRECWIVDSFVISGGGGGGGTGNPAAVVLLAPPEGTTRSRSGSNSSSSEASISSSTSLAPSPSSSWFNPDLEKNAAWMKVVAKEFNLSETAFIWETMSSSGSGTASPHYYIRFYTADGSEVDLCGHATLGASCVILQRLIHFNATSNTSGSNTGNTPSSAFVTFWAKGGVKLTAKLAKTKSSSGGSSTVNTTPNSNSSIKIVMDFPWKDVNAITEEENLTTVTSMIRNAFFPSLDLQTVREDCILFVGLDDGGDDLMVELTKEAFLALLKDRKSMNLSGLVDWDGYKRGIILCCSGSHDTNDDNDGSSGVGADDSCNGDSKNGTSSNVNANVNVNVNVDFMSRFFGPKVGINEDPVTGSAHCVLGPYFGKKLGKKVVVGKQMSERGGIVECTLKKGLDEQGIETALKGRVGIAGVAVTTMSGSLLL